MKARFLPVALVFLGALALVGPAHAQSSERFRFMAAADRWEPQRFEIETRKIDRAVNTSGFRHAAGPLTRRGKVFLLGQGVSSPAEVPPDRPLTPVSGSLESRPTRAVSPFTLEPEELKADQDRLKGKLLRFESARDRARLRRTASSGRPGLFRAWFGGRS